MSDFDPNRMLIGNLISIAQDTVLYRDLAVVNAQTIRELGSMPIGGLPSPLKRKPSMHRTVMAEPATARTEQMENETMRFRDLSLAAVMAVGGLSACNAATQSNGAAPEAVGTPTAQPTKVLDSKYKTGMAYAPFRTLLIADGWQPAASLDECLKLTVGDDYKSRCESGGVAEVCRVCTDFREISGCADDGYCYMTFSNGGLSLSVKAYGDIMKMHHDESEPVVEEWAISEK